MFPETRMRRLRENPILREMLDETSLSAKDFIYPLFVISGKGKREKIPSMPGIFRLSSDLIIKEARELRKIGVNGVILFGVPDRKDELGSGAYAQDGVVQKCVKKLKDMVPDILVITDVCLCGYTSHGHCGIIKNGKILNDETAALIADTALSHAKAGADVVAPSDMMDGRVHEIREVLDSGGFYHIPIMSYAVKYSTAFYGPFRDAAKSAPKSGDRKSHQMNMANSREAMREIELDISEGADIIMVKPAMPCLDIIKMAKERFDAPIAAYQVSGEYSMIKAADKLGYIDEKAVIIESLLSIKRAGADIIISYFAKDVIPLLK